MIPVWAQVCYVVAAVCFILALKGLSSPKTARRGNLVGAFGALLAVVVTFIAYDIGNLGWILLAVAVGAVGGALGARRVAMTAMPQLVALFNGVGGGAAALVALLELSEPARAGIERSTGFGDFAWFALLPGDLTESEISRMVEILGTGSLTATAFTALIGSVSFSGSVITFLKLQELMTGRPITFPGGPFVFGGVLVAALGLGVWTVATGSVTLAIVLALVGLLAGVLLVLPVGGADVPIVISLLNAFTGLAVAAGGYVLENALLLVAGTLVGASGTILTRAMAHAMGRSVSSILFGAFKGGSTAGGGQASDRPVRSAGPDDVAIMLAYARRVIVVPGYGLAVAQAQHTIRELVDLLEKRGVEVGYAIHPVAGRMPGHMNVLLAEANVPYEQLLEMDTANGQLRTADVALIVGANDVVNPAARTSPGSPIYGMPILDADHAGAIVFLKRSMRPGFAGIENELLFDPKTTLLFGDAKASLTALVTALKSL
ncbi:NAD(P)(+) transhydrogenase (Re/Si-specific) subunit beta [Jiangella rhizosphaerae]|uniref:NAD(P) transhydrogenase subunit beta n=1 Tax=Jiangella rhizosphaerae TaxID=2293569 RepID=A0A418KN59_9ACTN|nr:NAD(P)(+) transhydrogenase (Re/Si-specific) subunit beta [Jiangella rhizosphaerae]RIQ20353.1 NAD(P)(+) transhydrogenase (Re/Si-specific) subunit beta [Jiangella rhizosphaerae]